MKKLILGISTPMNAPKYVTGGKGLQKISPTTTFNSISSLEYEFWWENIENWWFWGVVTPIRAPPRGFGGWLPSSKRSIPVPQNIHEKKNCFLSKVYNFVENVSYPGRLIIVERTFFYWLFSENLTCWPLWGHISLKTVKLGAIYFISCVGAYN